MGKRIAIIFSLVLILALAIIGHSIRQGRKILINDPYTAISTKACIVIEPIDLQSFINSLTTGKGLFGEASMIKGFETFNLKLKYIADHINDPAIRKLISDRKAVIGIYPPNEGEIKILLSVSAGEIKIRQVRQILSSSGINKVIESKINNEPVLKLPYATGNSKDTAFISTNSGLILFTNSSELIKSTISDLKSGTDIRKAPGFSRVRLASGKNEDKIYLVFSNLADLIKPLLGWDRKDFADKITRLAGSAGGDIFINEDGLVLSGYTESTDSSDYLFKYKAMRSGEFETYKILPAGTALFETLILSDDKPVIKPGDSVSTKIYSLASRMSEFIGDEITRAYIDIRENQVIDNNIIIYKLNNSSLAEQVFLDETGEDKEILYFQPDDQIKMPVYKIPFSGMKDFFISGSAGGPGDTYFAFYDNFLITGSSYKTISRLLYDNILNNTLANDLVYRDFESSLPSRAGYFFFCVPSHIINYLDGFLNDDIINWLRENKNSINRVLAAGYQLVPSNGMLYNSLSIRFREEAVEESLTEWETLLDTTACIKPFFFTNHLTGAREIFVQDMRNNVYLINAAGRVLWKVPLSEKISGNIFMIDYYKNGKYQLLFSGKNYIHLLDRNGNYVERYPVKLRSPATNSLALFDYDNNLNYRLFIAGEDRMIYSYDRSGNVVKGWNPFRTAGTVQTQINYFQVSGKDYLAVSDEKSVYLLDRYGNRRVIFREPVTKAKGSSLKLNTATKSFLVCSSPDGTIQQINFDGTIKKFSLKKFSDNHSFDIFDANGDGLDEYIYIDKGVLYLYDHNRAEIFKKDFGSGNLGGPGNFNFSADNRMIGVFDDDKNLIYLMNDKGEVAKGFPLRGASMFSIGKLSEKSGWHLIVGSPDRFLYNYKIETEIK